MQKLISMQEIMTLQVIGLSLLRIETNFFEIMEMIGQTMLNGFYELIVLNLMIQKHIINIHLEKMIKYIVLDWLLLVRELDNNTKQR